MLTEEAGANAADFSTVAARLRCVRELAGLREGTLARLAGLQMAHLRQIERGTVQPRAGTIEALASPFGDLGPALAAWVAFGCGVPPAAAPLRAAIAPLLGRRGDPRVRFGAALHAAQRSLADAAATAPSDAARAAVDRAMALLRDAAGVPARRERHAP